MAKVKAEFSVVYLRIFSEDERAIRTLAKQRGSSFATELRMLVHEAVRGRQLGLKLLK